MYPDFRTIRMLFKLLLNQGNLMLSPNIFPSTQGGCVTFITGFYAHRAVHFFDHTL